MTDGFAVRASQFTPEGQVCRARYVETTQDELSRWLGRESGAKEPVRIVTDDADLSGDLKRGLTEVKRHKRKRR